MRFKQNMSDCPMLLKKIRIPQVFWRGFRAITRKKLDSSSDHNSCKLSFHKCIRSNLAGFFSVDKSSVK